jgi:drug/metabolite transporter (DMT)-like permease
MFTVASLWIPFTVTAAFGQVARNAMQRSLTSPLGTWGATNIRFLFGFPFSLIFFALVIGFTGDPVSWPVVAFWLWLLLGALTQIVGTGLMLLAMKGNSFVVTIAYLKTEAIQTAIFGFVFLGDHLTLLKVVAILIATVGVVITALRPGGAKGFADLKPTALGLVAAACFALSGVGFRGAIIAVPGVSFVTAASYTLVFGLFVQTAVLTAYLLLRAPDVPKEFSACGGHRCSRVFWARSPRNSGSWRSRSPPPPTFARWRWSRCCSRRRCHIIRSSSRFRYMSLAASC